MCFDTAAVLPLEARMSVEECAGRLRDEFALALQHVQEAHAHAVHELLGEIASLQSEVCKPGNEHVRTTCAASTQTELETVEGTSICEDTCSANVSSAADKPVSLHTQQRPMTEMPSSSSKIAAVERWFSQDVSDLLARSEQRLLKRLLRKGDTHAKEFQSGSLLQPSKTRQLRSCTQHVLFDLIVLSFIVLNSILIGVEVQMQAVNEHELSQAAAISFEVIAHVLSAIFLIELLLRMASEGCHSFFCAGNAWNAFDAAIVFISLLELLLLSIESMAIGQSTSNLRALRIVKIARLVRVLRVARLVRYIAPLRTLVYSIAVTIKMLIWAVVLLGIIMYIFAVVFTSQVSDVFHSGHEIDAASLEFFAGLWVSMCTLFKALCGGISWHVVTVPLANIHPILEVMFLAYISVAYFAVLNVMTGVFCSVAISAAENDPDLIAKTIVLRNEQLRKNATALSQYLDVDGSGFISYEEMVAALNDHYAQGVLMALQLEVSDALTMFRILDVEHRSLVSASQFVDSIIALAGTSNKVQLAKVSLDTRRMTTQLELALQLLHGKPTSPNASVFRGHCNDSTYVRRTSLSAAAGVGDLDDSKACILSSSASATQHLDSISEDELRPSVVTIDMADTSTLASAAQPNVVVLAL